MSDRTSGAESGEGVYGAAKEAIGSTAEQVRAAAPGTYDAGARAARYMGETASEHPFLVGIAVIAFLGGILSATVVAAATAVVIGRTRRGTGGIAGTR